MSKLIILSFLIATSTVMAAPIETFKFKSAETEKTFHKLSEELRCLVCQNQNIAESNADLAKDLRLEIYTMLINGQSESEIVDFMVQRYGDYVLYRPPFKPMTWLLWLGPLIIFLLGLVFAVKYLKSQDMEEQDKHLSMEEIERIKNLHAERD
ncbi:Cytochrome c heme lyase subunit CcmL [hydrothermal vent metagenome]|uniref:Cytochrome c heme lyase subunit CcmL n=1 Tax=hydrothermal vent metagenome TaxID=652676 RepID=A0A3B0WSU4_9ZZZZ